MSNNDRPTYDFDFICGALGVVPYSEGAFNIATIDQIQFESDRVSIFLRSGAMLRFTDADMVELEATIRRGQERAKAAQREAIKENIRAQMEVAIELQDAQQKQGAILIPQLQRKRGRA